MKAFLKFELTALMLVIISCAALLAPTELYAYDTDDENIHYLQSILDLKGMYSGPIDGIAGPETKKAIRLYKKQMGWRVNDQISDLLIEMLHEEAKLIPPNINPEQQNSSSDQEKLAILTQELNKIKEDLKNTNERLETITDNTSDQFISNFHQSVTLIGSLIGIGLGIMAALIGGLMAWGIPELKEKIEKETREKLKKEHKTMVDNATNKLDIEHKQILSTIQSKIYTNLSYAFYLYYKGFFHDTKHGGFRSGVSLALLFAEGAIVNAKRISLGEEQTILLKNAELHKLYHRACQCLIPELDSSIEREDMTFPPQLYQWLVE